MGLLDELYGVPGYGGLYRQQARIAQISAEQQAYYQRMMAMQQAPMGGLGSGIYGTPQRTVHKPRKKVECRVLSPDEVAKQQITEAVESVRDAQKLLSG